MDNFLIFSLSLTLTVCIALWNKQRKLKKMLARLKTRSRKKEQTLQIEKKQVESLSNAKSRYLSRLSHELRTPLNIIMGYTQLLEKQETTHCNHKLSLMRQNCEHINHLIEGLLEYSAMEAGKLKIHQNTFNLHELLKQLINMFEQTARNKNLSLDYQLSKNTPIWVKSDQQKLKQILINLLSNAIKFTERGSINLSVSYRSQVVTFSITDTGKGIKTDDLHLVFEPFERLSYNEQETIGSGLGLPIAKSLATLIGGELTVQSEWQNGSQFTLKLMLTEQQEPTIQKTHNTSTNYALKVLIVDDIMEQGALMEALLMELNHKPKYLSNADDALTWLESHDIDVCILDINMPKVDGWQLANLIRKKDHKTPIIMLSGDARDHNKSNHNCHQAYLNKPVLINELKHCLAQLNVDKNKQHITLTDSQKNTIHRLVEIGHINGIQNKLKEWYDGKQINQKSHDTLIQATNNHQLQYIKDLLNHVSHQ